jgi:hypothetical protein
MDNIGNQVYSQYFVEMFSPETWEVIPNSRIEMDAHEHVLSLKGKVILSQKRDFSAKR